MTRKEMLSFVALLLCATVFMGSSFPAGKFLLSHEHLPPFFLAGWRFVSAGLVVLFFCLVRYGHETVVPRSGGSILRGLGVVTVIGCLQTTAAMGFLNLSMERIDASIASVLFFTNPLWVMLGAHPLGIDRMHTLRAVGLVVGIAGVALCLGVHGMGSIPGLLFALMGAMSWALCTLVTSRFLRFDKPPFTLAGWQMLIGGVVLLGIAALRSESFVMASITSAGLFNLLWLILPASVGSFTLWFVALKRGGPAFTSSFLFLAPLFASLMSVVLLGDTPGPGFFAGGALIFLSIYLVNTRTIRLPRPLRCLLSRRRGAVAGLEGEASP
ncbi:DMT family transporter [Phaeovibrio sulfidiphilus]|uniref:DMT family transporter n=1 Tax=Phaeovibrio sulfidiphilus TaxID=1220600 RepID=A0A8J7CPQ4_9PROT|nr:DMT family transporter [Phaeovibrio sulfidiphilus]MBE1237307.1 DMT family transporter [Phaeovibrio sulfidiphilus]